MSGENSPMFGRIGEAHPMYGKTGEQHPHFGRTGAKHTMFGKARPDGAGKPAKKTSDKNTKITIIYNSIAEAARALNISDITCRRYLVTGKPYKDRYIFTKVS